MIAMTEEAFRLLADRVLDDVPSYAAAPWGVQE